MDKDVEGILPPSIPLVPLENEVSDFIVGENGVYKIRVIKKEISKGIESYEPYKNQLLQSKRPMSTNSLYVALKEIAEIEDNRSTYY